MGRVWLLKQSFAERYDPVYRPQIAVKTFDFVPDQALVENELNLWISLNHSSILPLLTIGRLNYRLAAVMPLMECSLEDVIAERGSLRENEITKILSEIVSGLDFAWSNQKLLHLDLKPSNILVDSKTDLRTKIADWGISRLVTRGKELGGTGLDHSASGNLQDTSYGAGTPLYMAPERFSGSWKLSPTADIYSLGMMAIQMATGILPFRFNGTSPLEEIFTASYFTNAHQILGDLSANFGNFCLQCIHPDPSARPATFQAVKNLLPIRDRGRYGIRHLWFKEEKRR